MMNSGMSAADVAVLSGATNRGCNDGDGGVIGFLVDQHQPVGEAARRW